VSEAELAAIAAQLEYAKPGLTVTDEELLQLATRLLTATRRLRTALAPFAALGAYYSDEEDDEYLLDCRDIRRAQAAMRGEDYD
jgi:hypothetical protein